MRQPYSSFVLLKRFRRFSLFCFQVWRRGGDLLYSCSGVADAFAQRTLLPLWDLAAFAMPSHAPLVPRTCLPAAPAARARRHISTYVAHSCWRVHMEQGLSTSWRSGSCLLCSYADFPTAPTTPTEVTWRRVTCACHLRVHIYTADGAGGRGSSGRATQ